MRTTGSIIALVVFVLAACQKETPNPYDELERRSPNPVVDAIPQNNPNNPKYRFFIEAWRRMPVGLANWLGPHIVRNLG